MSALSTPKRERGAAAPARLVAGERRLEVAPEDFAVLVAPLRAADLARARRIAGHSGRVFEREGFALSTWGRAASIELPLGLAGHRAAESAADLLSRFGGNAPSAERSALGVRAPVALGALPFDKGAPCELIVPEITVVLRSEQHDPSSTLGVAVGVARSDELARIAAGFPFTVAAGPADDGQLGGAGDDEEPPDYFELISPVSHRAFRALVGEAVASIERGGLEKVVLAREVTVRANRPLRQVDLLGRLRALHPSCAAFAIDGFIGASPELLCRRLGATLTSTPLAGTIPRSGDPEEDERLAEGLRTSAKERAEHQVVVDAILSSLEPYCEDVRSPEEPVVLELRNVAHLATTITARLRSRTEATGSDAIGTGGARRASSLELVAALHPTPAVGGFPQNEALAYIAEHERLDRDRYAGPVGYLDASGDGEWWVGIRSALVSGSTARLFAGVGIVEGSDPESELAETQLKLQALLAVAVRP